MLRVVHMHDPYSYNKTISSKTLYADNKTFTFDIEAPLFWWIDFDGMKFNFDLHFLLKPDLEPRTVLSNTRLSTKVKASLVLSYQEIVELCGYYLAGEYKYEGRYYQWPNEREWADFCETLMDISGIRDLIQEVI